MPKPSGSLLAGAAEQPDAPMLEPGVFDKSLQFLQSLVRVQTVQGPDLAARPQAFYQLINQQMQAQLAALCNISSLTEIDLHGMSKHEARAAVLCVLSMLVSEHQRGARHPAPLTIITGQGGHSAGRAAVLPKAVRQLLEELHIPLPGSPGALSDNVHSNGWYGDDRGGDGVNPGRIVVGSEQLVMWLKARSAARPTVCDRTPA